MSSSNTYYKELTDDNTETTQLMQQSNGSVGVVSNGTVEQPLNGGLVNGGCVVVVQCENGAVVGEAVVENGELKPISTEMSTSTASLKCCTGLWNHKRKFKIVKETQTPSQNGNGVSVAQNGNGIVTNGVGSNFYNTLKEKLANGKSCNGKVKEAKQPRPVRATGYVERDSLHINSHISYEFNNVFAEPNNGTWSFNPIWQFTNSMYFYLKLWLYRFFAIIIGIPSAFIWAIFFALFSVVQIWLLSPLLRLFKAFFGIIRDIWCTIVDTVFGPIFQLFQYVRVPVQQQNGANVV